MSFYLYKGLKKPLVFFGLKDKYIFWAAGFAIGGVIIALIGSNIHGLIGNLLGGIIGVGGVYFTIKTQDKKGLYNKRVEKVGKIFIFPNRIKLKK